MNKKINTITVFLIVSLLFTINYSHKSPQINNFNNTITDLPTLDQLNSLDLPIGIFYDERFSEPWNFQAQTLTNYLNQTLRTYNITVFVVNATELRNFMENNPIGIIIITLGVAPSTVWNGSEDSFIEAWLDNGGIIVWTGCQEFYWVGYETGENEPVGEVGSTYVLDMEYLETSSNQNMNPTQLGSDLILNLSAHSTDVFSSISALTAANVYFEVYAKKGEWADPVLFQPKNGKGYFVRIHADYNDQLSTRNLSTWISSFIYNRFFKLPIVTGINPVSSLYFFTSKDLLINVTNFSEFYKSIYINSTSNGFFPLNSSLNIFPFETRSLYINVTPLSTARFQQYNLKLNIYCNYTDFQNESRQLLIFTKMLYISVQSPISIEIQDIHENIYPGSTYQLSGTIYKYINDSLSVEVMIISEGCINELKKSLILKENITEFLISFSIHLMTKSNSYTILVRVYQNDLIISSADLSIQVESIFQSPLFLLILGIIIASLMGLLGLYLYQKRKQKSRDQDMIALLESKNIVFLRNITKILKISETEIKKRVNSCLKRGKLEGYLVYNEKNELIYVKKTDLPGLVLNIISKIKTIDIYQIARIINLDPTEIELILSTQIKNPES